MALGKSLMLPLADASAGHPGPWSPSHKTFADDARVTCALKPEAILLDADGVNGEIRSAVFTGASTEYVVGCDGLSLRVRVRSTPGPTLPRGARVGVTLDPALCAVFVE